jgi:hypothetical protein
MSLGEKIYSWFFNAPAQQTFASTPIVDAIAEEQYGTSLLPIVTRDEALSVPAVHRARNKICSTISTLPLKTYNAKFELIDNPLLREIDPSRTNSAVLSDTLEDLFLYKYAYWRVLQRSSDGFPYYMEHVAFDRVSEQVKDGRVIIFIDGEQESWENVRKFESPNPGFLKHGGRVVKRALDLDVTSAKFARNPRPLDYFTPSDDVDPLDDNGIRAFLQKWKLWLRNNVTGYVPAGMKYVSVDQPTPAELQLIEAQKQVGLSIANMTGIDPEEFGISTTSRTYSNVQDRRKDNVNEVYAPYMSAISERLSKGDVTKRGHQVFFDLTDFMKADDKTRMEVQLGYHSAGLLTDEEIRTAEHLPALPPRKEELDAGVSDPGVE